MLLLHSIASTDNESKRASTAGSIPLGNDNDKRFFLDSECMKKPWSARSLPPWD